MKHGIAATGTLLFIAGVWLFSCPPGLESIAQTPPSTLPVGEPGPTPAPDSFVPDSASYQLLTNPGVELYEGRYNQYEGVDCQVATAWQRFWEHTLPEPYWMDCRVFADSPLGGDWVERMEGETSQLVLSTKPYTAGIQQTVTGLTPGKGYGFHAAMLTIYQSSAAPDADGTMIKQVGMDPTGGTDPDAQSVVWCDPDGNDKGPWSIDLRTAVFTESPEMTVFVRVISPYPAGDLPYLNISFLDSAILALTPVVTATSPAVGDEPTFLVRWNNAVAAPGGRLKWYDVQWMDEDDGIWRDWFVKTGLVEAPFTGAWGHAYRFRARVWQEYENGAHLYGPYRPEGDTRTLVPGARLAGQVLTPEGYPVAGATVAVSGTGYAVASGADGRYEMGWPALLDPQVVTVSHPRWLSPPPVYGVTFGPTDTVAITWTLRPAEDAIVNGQFEEGIDGWSVLGSSAASAVVDEPVHTGHHALALGEVMSERTAAVSQTVALDGAWEPALSFWYDPAVADADNEAFTVHVRVVSQAVASTPPVEATHVFTPSLESGGWHHQWYPVGLPQAYLTGTVTVEFQLSREEGEDPTPVYLDEVSLGPTPGGPERAYLPIILR